jgi:hypothetical protein
MRLAMEVGSRVVRKTILAVRYIGASVSSCVSNPQIDRPHEGFPYTLDRHRRRSSLALSSPAFSLRLGPYVCDGTTLETTCTYGEGRPTRPREGKQAQRIRRCVRRCTRCWLRFKTLGNNASGSFAACHVQNVARRECDVSDDGDGPQGT